VLQLLLRRAREGRKDAKDAASSMRERQLVELGYPYSQYLYSHYKNPAWCKAHHYDWICPRIRLTLCRCRIGQLFLTLMKQEKYEVAYELCTARFESAQSDTPEHARSMVRLAQAQEAKRDPHGAIDGFTSVLEHYNTEHFQKLAGIGTSTLARIHYRLGRLYLNVGNKAAALEHATEAHRFWQHLVVSQNKRAAGPSGTDPIQMEEEAAIVGIERQQTRRVQ
jgi:tetratricopeptide (TPR) repeat protein